MPFLDLEGLTRYDQKNKQILASKQDATFSDGSPSIRVREMTSEEYAALSEQEKMAPIVFLLKDSVTSGIVQIPSSGQQATNSHSSFDVFYDPVNDEGIATLEESIEPPHIDSSSHPSSFYVSYA